MAHKRNINFEITVYESSKELTTLDAELMEKAVEARAKAYAPYSSFFVGAAVQLANGTIVLGNNQENACYPSGLCAERVAIYHAGAVHPNEIVRTIAITATTESHVVVSPVAPCGSCRQAILEYEFKQKSPIRLLLMGTDGTIIECNAVADLLPLQFNSAVLNIEGSN